MPTVLVVAIVFLGTSVQSLSGFGFALIAMPLVTIVLGVQTAAPLIALVGLTLYTINLLRFRRAVNVGELLRLGAASALGIPVGIWLLSSIEQVLVERILGAILIAYAAYVFLQPAARRALSPRWAYTAGFVAGCLGGAYNTPGPPVVVYGSLRQWPKDEFRAVLQALFLLNAVLVVASHTVAHHVTLEVLTFYLYAVPALVLGILIGSRIDRKVDRNRFGIIVAVMILILGMVLAAGVR